MRNSTSARAGRPRRPRRHRLLHHAHVRAEQGPHAQLQRHGPRRRHRLGHRSVHHQQADRLHGRWTFFHSGQIAISNSIKAGQDITYIILENKTTAMTGHQDHAGTESRRRSAIDDLHAEHRGDRPRHDRDKPVSHPSPIPPTANRSQTLLEDTILSDGVKVIIADKECGITYHRRESREERAPFANTVFSRRSGTSTSTPTSASIAWYAPSPPVAPA